VETEKKYLGIDIGSVAISLVLINRSKKILKREYIFHEGRISGKLNHLLKGFNFNEIGGVASTSSTPSLVKSTRIYDNRVAFINAAKHLHKSLGSLLIVGGEKFGLVLFDEKDKYRKFKSNSSCAAGTGSFLDQQAARLNLKNISEFGQIAQKNSGDFPRIASRCSVFAKTDLIHAQQEGYSLAEICDGLCYGLAKNIVDTLFKDGIIRQPMIFAGGVSQNRAVVKHIKELTGITPLVGKDSNLYGAIGAALNLINEIDNVPESSFKSVQDIILKDNQKKEYYYQPLRLELSEYPDFTSVQRYNYNSKIIKNTPLIEVDIYEDIKEKEYKSYLGIDIGSTSTKALLLGSDKKVLAGFYTRTSGQPVNAIKIILEAIDDIQKRKNSEFEILGVGTTGSGRKFIGKIIGADLIPDEISAHARAAVELDKEVDTIIEIGGQDAKFTTLKNGSVTFSVMNNVCAAGTGSFIEEQAKKLGVGLEEYSQRAENTTSPMASDRCTVFMERDLNHYINKNYKTNEILASVLHSVRENYLNKVALEKNIGKKIFFQGATAKNRALVAAFEQKLEKPIMVSKYCHLTGAYGVALELSDKQNTKSGFRGINLFKSEIPVRTEVCEFCNNHCKLKIAEIEDETVAYGFLCGRDYDSKKYVDNNIANFDLIKAYKKQFLFKPANKSKSDITIGIPAGLYLFEDLYLWQRFFDILKIKTITSSKFNGAVKSGKRISGAEFCAPMSAIQGHVDYLSDKTDFIFLPTYLEDNTSTRKKRRQYCYYSQFVPPVVASSDNEQINSKILNPLLFALQNEAKLKKELFRSITLTGIQGITYREVSIAYDLSKGEKANLDKKWKQKFKEISSSDNGLKVVLLGRPYTVLSHSMNNSIPEIFAQKGVKTFFQNMLNINENDFDSLKEILSDTKWKFASAILSAAEYVARTKDLYPVFITSFKCAPDSFILEYFKEILDFYEKPYLVLQLDEYDSNVGYETRIEAALRSFNNHFNAGNLSQKQKANFSHNNIILNADELKGKKLLMPTLGEFTSRLLEANLRRHGIEAHTLFDTEDSIKKSLISNTGQCLPLNIILQDAFDYLDKHQLDPSNTVIWMMESPIACNLGMFINYMSKQLKVRGEPYDKIRMYAGNISFADISINVSINSYLAYLFGGYLRKTECKLRPYELKKGETDKVVQKSMKLLYETFKNGTSKEEALKKVISWFRQIKISNKKKPKVAIFGDLYARDNDIFNQDLIRFIEKNGGEAITTPYSDYIKIVFSASNKRIINEGFYLKAAVRKMLISLATRVERKYLDLFNEILNEPKVELLNSFEKKLNLVGLKTAHNGESIENVLKIFHLTEQYPDIALFVQTNPSYCCPSLITEAMASKLEKLSGVPIVTIEYDGTSAGKNEDIIPFLKYH